MSFDALGKMSVGAAAGVVAERGGYVDHALSQLSDTIGVTAEAFGLPAIPDAGGLVASNAETFRFPTSAAEATDFVAAGLKAAREMLQQYLPDATYVPSEAQMPSPGGGSAAASRGADGEASRAASVATTGFFLAGAGAAAAVYTFGPETFKARVDKHYAVARRALHEVSVTLDRKLREPARRRASRRRAPRLAPPSARRSLRVQVLTKNPRKRLAGARRRGARRRGRRGGAAAVLARGVRGGRAGVPGDRGAGQAAGRGGGGGGGGASQTGVANGGSRDFGVGSRRRARAGERRISTLKVKHLERS